MGDALRAVAVLGVLVSGFASGCSEAPTQVVVRVATDIEVGPGRDADAIVLAIDDGEGALLREVRLDDPSPTSASGFVEIGSFGVHTHEASRRFTVRAAVSAGASPRFETRARSGFVEHRTIRLDLYAPALCLTLARTCRPDETCGIGGCRSPEVPAANLPVYGGVDDPLDPSEDPRPEGRGPPAAEFPPAVALAEVNDPEADDRSPSCTQDRLELYFVSNRAGGERRLWVAGRGDASAPWGPPELAPGLEELEISKASVSPDGLELVLGAWVSGFSRDLFASTRATRTAPWPAPVLIEPLRSTDWDDSGETFLDGSAMVFHSDRPGVGSFDLWSSTREPGGPWQAPTLLSDVSGPRPDFDPSVTEDGLTMVFESSRSGRTRIYRVERSAVEDAFGGVQELGGLTSHDTEAEPWISEDGRDLIFVAGAGAPYDLYESRR